jgi:alkylated DNA repair protein (DNA oxidative demethylase)
MIHAHARELTAYIGGGILDCNKARGRFGQARAHLSAVCAGRGVRLGAVLSAIVAGRQHEAAWRRVYLMTQGFRHLPGALDDRAQRALLAAVREVIEAAPLYVPRMPRSGKAFSVRMTNCGPLGWVSDKDGGYRYQASHPETGKAWPPMPAMLLELWRAHAGFPAPPEACLVNYYAPDAKLGLHRDEDEQETAAAVLSLSLGDEAVFRIGGLARTDATERLLLRSGDIVVLGGAARLAYHGIDRIKSGTSALLAEGGRFNLTLRRVTRGQC